MDQLRYVQSEPVVELQEQLELGRLRRILVPPLQLRGLGVSSKRHFDLALASDRDLRETECRGSQSITPSIRLGPRGPWRFGREKLADEGLRQPGLEALRRPAPTMDEHVVGAWPEQPDDVGGRFRVEAMAYPAFSGQVPDDIGRPLSMLRQVGFPERAGVRIDPGSPPDRLMDSRQATVDLGHELRIEGQVLAGIRLCSNRL